MNKKPYSTPFHSAEQEVSQTKVKKIKRPGAVYPYKIAFTDLDFMLREELRPVRLQLELLKPELVLRDHNVEQAVVFFGSARTPEYPAAKKQVATIRKQLAAKPKSRKLQKQLSIAENILANSRYIKEAEDLAQIILKDKSLNFDIISGGGPGFMEAANRGAHMAKKRSIALNVLLPHEQAPNPYVTPELTFQFHYFAIRKMHFLMRAKALVAFPGGFGTMDELFESLTLIQTQKIDRIPLLLFNKHFWQRIINFEALVEEGTISEKDLALFQFVETAQEAWQKIQDFYSS